MPYKVASGRTLFASKNYQAKVLDMFGSSIVAFWPQNEAGGTVSRDIGGRGFNGAYTGVTLRAQGVGDGETAASFDGTTSYNNVYSAGLASAFNNQVGTLLAWARVSGAGVWTDGISRSIVSIAATAGNRVNIVRSAISGFVNLTYRANGTQTIAQITGQSATGYQCYAMTYDKPNNAVRGYLNGAQFGATQTGLDVWAGTLSSTLCCVGSIDTTPTTVWSGTIGPILLLNRVATAGEIAAASTL